MTRVWVAAGVSLALHLGVMFVVLRGESVPVAPLAREKPVQVEVMRVGVISPKPRAEPVAAAPVVVQAKSKAPPVPVAAVAVGVGVGVEVTVDPESRGTQEPSTQAGSPAGNGGSEASPPALDTSALSRRLQQVALRCYPAAARRFRQIGEAQVRFCLDAAGSLRESAVSGTSGSDLLDRAATDCVIPGAAPFGPETFGRCFTVPVRFHN